MKARETIMKRIAPNHGDWVVVCDGRKALILENYGDETYPNLREKEQYQHADVPTHLQGSSRPGRSYQSIGRRRSAVGQTDLHDESERSFLRALAKRVDHALQDKEISKMTIVAPPRALGMLRDVYTPAIRSALLQEIAKDAVKMPLSTIERLVFCTGN
jgi:protein required for attachment to host cells